MAAVFWPTTFVVISEASRARLAVTAVGGTVIAWARSKAAAAARICEAVCLVCSAAFCSQAI